MSLEGVSAAQPHCLSMEPGQSVRQAVEKSNITEVEIFTRLVMAEGFSTNAHLDHSCKSQLDAIYESIAWGVMNRVVLAEQSTALKRKFGEGLSGVIFHPAQFNPAISSHSRYAKFFLCPQMLQNWEAHWKMSESATARVLQAPGNNPFLLTPWEKNHQVSLVSHFYYPLSSQASARPPQWADTSSDSKTFLRQVKVRGKALATSCIWFFRNEKPFPLLAKKQQKTLMLKRLIQQKLSSLLEEIKEQSLRQPEKVSFRMPLSDRKWNQCMNAQLWDAAEKGRCETVESFSDRCLRSAGLTKKKLEKISDQCAEK